MIPWFLWMPISRDPNSVLATALTFVPPSATSSSCCGWPRSTPRRCGRRCWRSWRRGGVFASLWFAARVFRIGLLMYGKPPNLATLIRWARTG